MAKLGIQYDQMMNPVLQALKSLGGSGTNEEINHKVAEIVDLSPEEFEILHNPGQGGLTEFEYRLMWTRTYLKKYGLLENSSRGIWALTPKGTETDHVDPKKVVKTVRELMRSEKDADIEPEDEPNKITSWQNALMASLLSMPPDAFERLVQRFLRESGFIQVEVTGRSGDGGIDGQGIMRLGGLLSFQIIFQCKRWQGSVGAGVVRDFRGAMVGRADKGLIITTGTFTKEAVKEATRDGAPAIDLVDGDQLLEKLKQLELGVEVKKIEIEQVTVNKEWFAKL